MSALKQSERDLREGLEWRGDRLPKETAFLAVMRETVSCSSGRVGKLLRKIDRVLEISAELLRERGQSPAELTAVERQQAVVYAMVGPDFGGYLPGFATQQPADFYIDDRCGPTLYPRRAVYAAVAKLRDLAEQAGIDPHNVPSAPSFHNYGAW
jgi:hypothetical protein